MVSRLRFLHSNPIGVIFAALFVAHISVGGAYLPTKYYQPEIADLIVAVIIYLCAFVTLFKGIVANLFKSKKSRKQMPMQTTERRRRNNVPFN